MGNSDIEAALAYHAETSHSPESIRASRRTLDWNNQPRPYKLYRTLDPIPLPEALPPAEMPALEAITPSEDRSERVPDLATLASILHFTAGITKLLRVPGGQMPFRAAACTGALYHIELYVICGDLPDLQAGVYQFGAHDHALRRLRAGDFRSAVVEATGGHPSVAHAPVIIASTSTFWRNAWKYEARAYRHVYWDDGTILANLLAMARASGLPTDVVLGFVDRSLDRLLGVETEHEATVSLVTLGRREVPPPTAPPVSRLDLQVAPLSAMETDYPAIHAMHSASSLSDADEVATWHRAASGALVASDNGSQQPSQEAIPLQPLLPDRLPNDPIDSVIQRRGSSRSFAPTPITLQQLTTILERATHGFPADFRSSDRALCEPYLIVNAVDGLPSGAYVFNRDAQRLELLQAGSFRQESAYLALAQEFTGEAAINVYFMADLRPILERFGNRGYRAAQLDASVTAGRMYLASYALRLGATGLTFFDDEVTRFFSSHAVGKSVLFLLAIGHRAPRH